jgi:hypothetical protein
LFEPHITEAVFGKDVRVIGAVCRPGRAPPIGEQQRLYDAAVNQATGDLTREIIRKLKEKSR